MPNESPEQRLKREREERLKRHTERIRRELEADCPGEQGGLGGWNNGKGFDFRRTQRSVMKPEFG